MKIASENAAAIRVIIFEEDNRLQKYYRALLSGSAGFECAAVHNSNNGFIKKICASRPHVVLMGIKWAAPEGTEAVKVLKDQFPEIKILIHADEVDEESIFENICSRTDGCLLKNTSADKILEAIREVHQEGVYMPPSVILKITAMLRNGKLTGNGESFHLTIRELEVLKQLAEGKSKKSIADNDGVSVGTIVSHVKNIYKKLHVHSKSEAVAKGIREKIV